MPTPSVHRRLFDLAWPIIGVNVLNVLALAVDTAMLGRIEGAEDALTGLGYATQLVFLLMVAMMGLTVGTVAFVARAHGAEHGGRVHHILHQSVQLTVLLGLAVAVLGNLGADPAMRLLGADDASRHAGLLYLRPLLLGTAFNYLTILYAAVLRGVGNTRLAFSIALLMNAANVLLNYGLILGNYGLPALGIQGAALGTVTAHFVSAAAYNVVLWLGVVPSVRPALRLRAIDIPLARDLIRVGWPAALDMVVLNAALLSIIGMLGRIDQAAVGAHGIGLRIQALAFVPGMSISQATGALVGNALGAGRVDEARAVLRASVVQCTLVMSTLGLLFVAGAGTLVEVFDVSLDTPLGAYSVTWVQLLGVGMPPVGLWVALAGLFQGSGATRTSLRINLWVTLVQIPASWVLGFPLGLSALGVWAAFPAAFVLKSGLGLVAYRRGGWATVGARA